MEIGRAITCLPFFPPLSKRQGMEKGQMERTWKATKEFRNQWIKIRILSRTRWGIKEVWRINKVYNCMFKKQKEFQNNLSKKCIGFLLSHWSCVSFYVLTMLNVLGYSISNEYEGPHLSQNIYINLYIYILLLIRKQLLMLHRSKYNIFPLNASAIYILSFSRDKCSRDIW